MTYRGGLARGLGGELLARSLTCAPHQKEKKLYEMLYKPPVDLRAVCFVRAIAEECRVAGDASSTLCWRRSGGDGGREQEGTPYISDGCVIVTDACVTVFC